MGKVQSKETGKVKPCTKRKGEEIEVKRLNILAWTGCWYPSLLNTITT